MQTIQGFVPLNSDEFQALKVNDVTCVILGKGDNLQVMKVGIVKDISTTSKSVRILEWIEKGKDVPNTVEYQIEAELSASFGEFFHLPAAS